jgi:hypothetical protein
MISKEAILNLEVTDEEFNLIYPERIRTLAKQQWTPLDVSKLAAKYLAETPGTKVLDIGSGVGKFCMIGATSTEGIFTGVEQRQDLVEMSNKLAKYYGIKSVKYVHSNITEIAFTDFDTFYFFNAFYENIDRDAMIDHTIERGIQYYNMYNRYVSGQLAKMPLGTKLVTYWSSFGEIPGNYEIQFEAFEGNLKFWKKVS